MAHPLSSFLSPFHSLSPFYWYPNTIYRISRAINQIIDAHVPFFTFNHNHFSVLLYNSRRRHFERWHKPVAERKVGRCVDENQRKQEYVGGVEQRVRSLHPGLDSCQWRVRLFYWSHRLKPSIWYLSCCSRYRGWQTNKVNLPYPKNSTLDQPTPLSGC